MEDYIFSLVFSIIILILPAFLLGLICWFIWKKKQPDKIKYFIAFNLLGLIFLICINLQEAFKIWHYNKYQANIDYNKSLSRENGDFLDTCIMMVQKDIEINGVSPNNYRFLTYSYDQALTTFPRDTANQFYSFEVIYSKTNNDLKSVRAASYFVSFSGRIKKLYDVDIKNEKAKKQVVSLKQNLKEFKKVSKEFPDLLP